MGIKDLQLTDQFSKVEHVSKNCHSLKNTARSRRREGNKQRICDVLRTEEYKQVEFLTHNELMFTLK